jgi:uncharacterized protein DUF1569
MKSLARPDDLAEILRRLRTLRPDTSARWGRMSAHQMICHLADALCVATGQKTVSPATGPVQRTFIKWIALYVPLPWPAGVATRPEIDQEIGGTKPQEFADDVARVESLLKGLARNPGTNCPEHPIFGPMSATAWLRWGYLHADHHLRQFGA